MSRPPSGMNWGRTTGNSAKEPDVEKTNVKEVFDPNKQENASDKDTESEHEGVESIEDEQDSLHDNVESLKATITKLTATLSTIDAKFGVNSIFSTTNVKR